MCLQLSENVSANWCELSNGTLYCRNFPYACNIFPLNNMFPWDQYILLSNTFDFSVENCQCSNVSLTDSKVPPVSDSFEQNIGVTIMGLYLKWAGLGNSHTA